MIRYLKKVREAQSRAMLMVRDFVMGELYPNWGLDELAAHWQTTRQHVERLTRDEDISLFDLIMFLAFSEIDFGITIRTPSGRETTFFPAPNVGTLDHEEVAEEDLDYTKMDESTPVEADGSFEIADDDSEYDQLLCENCGENERISDSLLCHPCVMAGVIANPPDDMDRELEVMAHIDQEALRCQQRSRRLADVAEGDEFDELDLRLDHLERSEDGLTRLSSLKHLDDREDDEADEEEEEGGSYLHGDDLEHYAPEMRPFFEGLSDDDDDEELTARQRALTISEEEE